MTSIIAYLDRRVSNTTAGVSAAYASTTTTWTLPYSVPVNGSEGVLVVMTQGNNGVLTSTRPSATTIAVAGADYRNTPVWIGVSYGFQWTLSNIYVRGKTGAADTNGQLNLRYLSLDYEDSTEFLVTVTEAGKADRTYPFTSATPASGIFKVPIMARNTTVTITITSPTADGCAFSGFLWDGEYYVTARQI